MKIVVFMVNDTVLHSEFGEESRAYIVFCYQNLKSLLGFGLSF